MAHNSTMSIGRRLTTWVSRAVAPLRGGGRGWALVAIALAWLLILGTRITFPVLLPGIRESFGINNATAGFVITVIWGVYALSQFPAGILGDRVGDRLVLIASLAIMTVSVLVFSFAPTFLWFLTAAVAIGVGNGLYGPTRGTLLSAIYPNNRSTAIGVTLAVGSVGAASLPFLAGIFVGEFGWRLTIAGAVPLLFVTMALAWAVVPSTGPTDESRTGSTSSVRARIRTLSTALVRRSVILGTSGKSLRVFVFQGFTAFLPTYLISVKGFPDEIAGTLLSVIFVVGAVAQVVGGRMADRFGDRYVLVSFAGLSALPMIALPFASDLAPILVIVVLIGIQLGITPVTNSYLIQAVPDTDQGGAWGFLRMVYFLVGSTGSVVVGVFADAGFFDEAFFFLGVLLFVVTGIFAILPAREGVDAAP